MSVELNMLKCRKCNVILSEDIIMYDYNTGKMKIVCPVCKNTFRGNDLDDLGCDFDEVIL